MKHPIEDEPNLVKKLQWLYSHYQKPGDGVAQTCRVIADELSHKVELKANWSWRYVHQAMRGKIEISSHFGQAINRLELDQRSAEIREYELVTIVAPVGYVSPGALVEIASRLCKNPICSQYFVPKTKSQKYCCANCRKRARKNTPINLIR